MDELREHFEQNMLDGDSVDACGGATLSAKSVLEYLSDTITKREKALLTGLLDEAVPCSFGDIEHIKLSTVQSAINNLDVGEGES